MAAEPADATADVKDALLEVVNAMKTVVGWQNLAAGGDLITLLKHVDTVLDDLALWAQVQGGEVLASTRGLHWAVKRGIALLPGPLRVWGTNADDARGAVQHVQSHMAEQALPFCYMCMTHVPRTPTMSLRVMHSALMAWQVLRREGEEEEEEDEDEDDAYDDTDAVDGKDEDGEEESKDAADAGGDVSPEYRSIDASPAELHGGWIDMNAGGEAAGDGADDAAAV